MFKPGEVINLMKMYVIVEVYIESGGYSLPKIAFGPFKSFTSALEALTSLQVAHKDDPVDFTMLKLHSFWTKLMYFLVDLFIQTWYDSISIAKKRLKINLLPGLNKHTMNTNTCNISLKQHILWRHSLASVGTVAAVYNTSIRGDFTPSMEQEPGG